MEKKRKIIVCVSVAVGLLVLGGGMLGFHNYSVALAKEEKQVKLDNQKEKLKTDIEKNQKIVDGFYTSTKKEDIKPNLEQTDLVKIDKFIKTFEGKELAAEIGSKLNTLITNNGYAKSMFETRNLVKSLLDDNGVLVENANIPIVEKKLDELKEVKPFFVEQQEIKLSNAKKQQEDINSATIKVNKLFTSDKKTEVNKDVTRISYNEAKNEVNKIKQTKVKEDLTKNLALVNKYLSEEEKKTQQQTEKNIDNKTNNESTPSDSNSGNSSQSNASENNRSSSQSPNNNSGANNSSGSSSSGGNSRSSSSGSGSSSSKGKGPAAKSSGGNSSSEKKSSSGTGSNKSSNDKSSGKKPNNNSSEKSWNGSKENKGTMKSDEGREYGTIDW
ncbi:hypothetical protein HB964_13270 [Listeria welshimeri]|nr:hypothetical protein [Listeria welshimeri]